MRSVLVVASAAVLVSVTTSAASAQTGAAKQAGSKLVPAAAAQPSASRGPTPDELGQAAAIKSEIEAIERQIGAAQAEGEKFTGGLTKARIESRIAQLRYTAALLQTRQRGLELGARLTAVELAVSVVDEAMAVRLEREIEDLKSKISETDAKANQYSGGLVKAQLASTAALMRETLALMEQRRLVAKYGLVGAPVLPAVAAPDTANRTGAESKRVAVSPEQALKDTIIKVRLANKRYHEYKYDKSIFFEGEFVADGLDKPARSIKGIFKVQDLFGETKIPIKWTISQALSPGQAISFSGQGIDYNQFINSHQWLRSTVASDMQVVFSVESILYDDGNRRDF